MRKFAKKFLSLMLAVSFCLAFSLTAYASVQYESKPEIECELTLSGNQAVMFSDITADPSVTKIVITHALRYDDGNGYKTIATRTGTFYSSTADKEDKVALKGSGSYQVKATYKITGPSGTETHTKYSNVEIK